MIKVLWLSSAILSNDSNGTGSWLYSMSKLLVESGEIHLVNIAVQWGRRKGGIMHKMINEHLEEYLLPNYPGKPHGGKPFRPFVEEIEKCINLINPEIIHVWGAEPYFSKLIGLFRNKYPMLLDIQGLREESSDVYRGDLTLMDSLKLLSIRDLLTFGMRSLFKRENDFRKRGILDTKAIMQFDYISTQSQWVRDVLSFYSQAHIYKTKMSIREEFLETEPWKYPHEEDCPMFYFSASGAIPYKCIQTAFKAIALVKTKYPTVRLKVAGNFRATMKWKDEGYQRYLIGLLDKLDIRDSVDFIGNLTAKEIVYMQKKCIAVLQTSFIETYSLVNAEALCLGIPVISTFAGAIPELGNEKTIMYYQPGDYRICAARMVQLIEDADLAEKLSLNAVDINRKKHCNNDVLECQLSIYRDILNRESKISRDANI